MRIYKVPIFFIFFMLILGLIVFFVSGGDIAFSVLFVGIFFSLIGNYIDQRRKNGNK